MNYHIISVFLTISTAIFAVFPVCADESARKNTLVSAKLAAEQTKTAPSTRNSKSLPKNTQINESNASESPANSATKQHFPGRNNADASASGAKASLDELQRDMAPITGIDSEFTQVKKLSIFSKTLTITGRMKIRMPRYFKWEVVSPLKSTVVADGDNVAIWDEETNKTVTMSLKDNPVAGGIWTQIDSFFMGRYDKLKKMYAIKLIKPSPLTLRFTPRSKPLSTVMKNVTLTFAKDKRGRYLKRVMMCEKGGDSTTIDFKNVKLRRAPK